MSITTKKPKQKQRGSLVRVVTNSEISSTTCQKSWWYKYVEGLNAGKSRAPLLTGGLWGDVMDAYWNTGFEITDLQMDQAVIIPWLEKRIHHIEETEFDVQEAANKREEANAIADLTLGMFDGYCQTWREIDKEEWEVVAVEPQVARWIINPETGKTFMDYVTVTEMEDGLPVDVKRRRLWCYGGKIDKIARRKSDGAYFIFEHKTTGDTNLQQYQMKLTFDPQIRGYPWALMGTIAKLSEGVSEPIRVRGVIYDTARKVVPRVPEPIAKCECKHPKSKHRLGGCDGAAKCTCTCFKSQGMSVAAIVTTAAVYKQALVDNGLNPDEEKYRDKIASLPGIESFYQRVTVPITDRDLADFEQNMTAHTMNIMEWTKRSFHPRNQANCTSSGSYPCDHRSICIEDGEMGRANFTVMTIRHRELSGAMSEPNAGKERGLLMSDDDDAAKKLEALSLVRLTKSEAGFDGEPEDDLDLDNFQPLSRDGDYTDQFDW